MASLEHLADRERLRRRVGELKGEGPAAPRIAERLDTEGLREASVVPITAAAVGRLAKRYGLARERPVEVVVDRGEWLVPDLARRPGVPPATVYSRARRGVVGSRRAAAGDDVSRGVDEPPGRAPEEVSGVVGP